MKTSLRRNIPKIVGDDATEEAIDKSIEGPSFQRSQRQRSMPIRFGDYEVHSDSQINNEGDVIHFALMAVAEPINEVEALQHTVWKDVMIEELKSIEKNKTWNLVDLPSGKHQIGVKWVFKKKLNPDASVSKHKARLVAKGFLQKQGLDYS